MTLSYGASVILLSFAILGLWCFFKELWTQIVKEHLFTIPKITFFILVKNIEDDIEEMLRHLALEIENSKCECEVILIDYTSEDLTYPIAKRLAKEYAPLISVYDESSFNDMKLSLLCCEGKIMHIIDMTKCFEPKEFVPLICWLLRENN